MSDLPNRARSLHRSLGLTPQQIRNRSGFLDDNHDPCIPLSIIQSWLVEADAGAAATALPQQASIYPANIPPRAVAPLDGIQQVEDHRALHDKVARLEAQLTRLSFERNSRTPSPAITPRAVAPSDRIQQAEDHRALHDKATVARN